MHNRYKNTNSVKLVGVDCYPSLRKDFDDERSHLGPDEFVKSAADMRDGQLVDPEPHALLLQGLQGFSHRSHCGFATTHLLQT